MFSMEKNKLISAWVGDLVDKDITLENPILRARGAFSLLTTKQGFQRVISPSLSFRASLLFYSTTDLEFPCWSPVVDWLIDWLTEFHWFTAISDAMPRGNVVALSLLGHGQIYFLIQPNMPSFQWEDVPAVSYKSSCPTLMLICWALIKDKKSYFRSSGTLTFSVV